MENDQNYQDNVNNNNYKRPLPTSELDLNLMLTNTVWGNPELSPALKSKLLKDGVVMEDEEGNKYISREDLWSTLGFYTRDLRLGNLSTWNNELQVCQYYLNLANDFLKEGFTEPFIICLSRVATILETSQSKGGFLRRRINTFTSESMSMPQEPKKRTLWGTSKEVQ